MVSPKKNLRPGWNIGPPPSIGWWPASATFSENTYRWWNGDKWSVACSSNEDAKSAGFWGTVTINRKDYVIYWKPRPDSWPEWSKT